MDTSVLATFLFVIAVLQTFSSSVLNRLARRYRNGSVAENFFHLLGEVEVSFGLWAGVFICSIMAFAGKPAAVDYLNGLNFTEPAFVFVIMTVASTKPILDFASALMSGAAKWISLPGLIPTIAVSLTLGPLLGSYITEPAAMTVTALLLKEKLFDQAISDRLRYSCLAALFVNVSIGGVLTAYAAPPVLMVARTWAWDTLFMKTHFGWKAIIACSIISFMVILFNRSELSRLKVPSAKKSIRCPIWLTSVYLVALALIVINAHESVLFAGVFLFLLGVHQATKEFNEPLKLRSSLLVAFFLAGLVVLGRPQSWWLQPFIEKLDSLSLFLGATALTAITDNAALTYLGSQIHDLSDAAKYALVAGAVTGGGLTVIANAPNPAGYSILNSSFGANGISALKLFLFALPPTLIAAGCFWLL